MSDSPAPARPELPTDIAALTAVRFFAAFAVVVFHFGKPIRAWTEALAQGAAAPVALLLRLVEVPLDWGIHWGYLGVAFFFVLSGFILTHVYLGGPAPGPIHLRRFWVARIGRIYPVYLIGMLLAGCLLVPGALDKYGPQATRELAKSGVPALLLVHGWVCAWVPIWNYPSWSVCAEAFFYLVFPWIAPALARMRFGPRAGVTAAIWIVGISIQIVFLILWPSASPGTNTEVRYAPLFNLDQFVVGIFAGRFYEEYRPRLRGDLITVIGLAIVATALTLLTGQQVPGNYMAPAFAVVIVGLAAGGRVARLLSGQTLISLGLASYALYTIQSPLSDLSFVLFARFRPELFQSPAGLAAEAALSILIMVAASFVIMRVVENPARHWIVRRFSGPRPGTAPVLAAGVAGGQ